MFGKKLELFEIKIRSVWKKKKEKCFVWKKVRSIWKKSEKRLKKKEKCLKKIEEFLKKNEKGQNNFQKSIQKR